MNLSLHLGKVGLEHRISSQCRCKSGRKYLSSKSGGSASSGLQGHFLGMGKTCEARCFRSLGGQAASGHGKMQGVGCWSTGSALRHRCKLEGRIILHIYVKW